MNETKQVNNKLSINNDKRIKIEKKNGKIVALHVLSNTNSNDWERLPVLKNIPSGWKLTPAIVARDFNENYKYTRIREDKTIFSPVRPKAAVILDHPYKPCQ